MNHRFQNLCAVIVFAAVMLTLGCDRSKELSADRQRSSGTVSLELDFGDVVKRGKQIDVVCSANSTVLLSLERAQQTGDLKFESIGSGETAFVESIDGIANENGKSWVYNVNDKLGDRSAGIMAVKPGDAISWTYGTPPDELK